MDRDKVGRGLTDRQKTAALLVSKGLDYGAIAAEARVTGEELWRWRQRPDFSEAIRLARYTAFGGRRDGARK